MQLSSAEPHVHRVGAAGGSLVLEYGTGMCYIPPIS